jgi:hypothetical protein
VISISHIFDEHWAVFKAVFFSPFHGFSNHKNVLSVTFEPWDDITSSVVVGVGSSFSIWSSHSVKIVFTQENTWEFPQSSHIGSLCNLPLISSSISIHSNSNVLFLLIFHSKS